MILAELVTLRAIQGFSSRSAHITDAVQDRKDISSSGKPAWTAQDLGHDDAMLN